MEIPAAGSDVQVYLGDCLEVMQSIPDASINLVLADLPYGTTACKWDAVIPFEPLWAAYRRILVPNGAVVLTASQPFTSALVMSNPKWFRHEWIWRKDRGSNFANTVREPMKEHESVIVFSAGNWTYNKQMQARTASGSARVAYDFQQKTDSENFGNFKGEGRREGTAERVPSSVQIITGERGLHPTQKPVALMAYMVRTYTNPGDTVLDNTCGSGTTGVACIEEGRRFIGIEKDPAYFEVAQSRLDNARAEQERKNKPSEQRNLFDGCADNISYTA